MHQRSKVSVVTIWKKVAMSKSLKILISILFLSLTAQADIYLYNTTDERMTFEVFFPNGDSKTGTVNEDRGYGPEQTTIPGGDGVITTFKLTSESGGSAVEVKAAPYRTYILAISDGGMKVLPVGWSMENGQTHVREMQIFNATGQPQTFDLIDEKEMRKGITIAPGKSQAFPSKNGFSGSSGFHHLKFANGKRVENQARSGDFVLLYNDKRYPGEVRVGCYGHLTAPRNTPGL